MKGIIKIDEGLTLYSPTLEIKTAYIEALFTDEDGNKHSRLMQIDLDTINIVSAKKSNEVLNVFI